MVIGVIEEIKWLGKAKVTKMTSKNRVYPAVRLGTDETIIGKTVQVYQAKFLNGLRGFIILDSSEPIDLSRVQAETQVSSSTGQLEQRISRLEKAVEQLTQMLSQRESSGSCDSGFDARSCAGVAEPGQRRETQDLLP